MRNKFACSLGTLFGFALWIIPSAGQLVKYLGASGAGVSAVVALASINALLRHLGGRKSEKFHQFAPWLLLLAALVTVVAFGALYPISMLHIFGPGSDRADALDTALKELLRGGYPYYVKTYLGNPPTPAPGALLLALPFYLIGGSALQNLFWLPFFLYYCRYRLFGDPAVALSFYLIFFLGCPGALQDFATGGDYLVNAIYVAIAASLVLEIHEFRRSRIARWAAYSFLAVAISSRAFYGVIVPVLAVHVAQREGMKATVKFTCVTILLILALNGPFLAYDLTGFAPLKLGRKLDVVPHQYHALLVLPLLSILIALASAFVALDERKFYGTIAIALSPLFVVYTVFNLSSDNWPARQLIGANYFLPVTVYGGIWLMMYFTGLRGSTSQHNTSAIPDLRMLP
jgi:hypothetical protein